MSQKGYNLSANTFNERATCLSCFKLFQVAEVLCEPGHEIREHKQNCYEISAIEAGSGVFFRNGNCHPVKAGDIFLNTVGDVHRIQASEQEPIHFNCIGFIFDKSHPDFPIYEEVCNSFSGFPSPISQDNGRVFQSISNMISEIGSPSFLINEMLKSYMISAVIHTYRCFHSHAVISNDRLKLTYDNPLVSNVVHFINDNLYTLKNLTEISEALGYSYSYLTKTFSTAMKISIKDYYARRRFEAAALLLSQQKSVGEVAEIMNFSDIQTFSKAFKRYYQLTPKEYRTAALLKKPNNPVT